MAKDLFKVKWNFLIGVNFMQPHTLKYWETLKSGICFLFYRFTYKEFAHRCSKFYQGGVHGEPPAVGILME